jgi:5-methylcytosine-specific restriction endonuclease McrA
MRSSAVIVVTCALSTFAPPNPRRRVDVFTSGVTLTEDSSLAEKEMGRKIYDWRSVQRHYDDGNERDACMAHFGFGVAAWYKAIRRGKLKAELKKDFYDWRLVNEYYNKGHTYRECRTHFGFSAGAWQKAVKRGVIKPRPLKWTLKRLLAESRSRFTIKRRLLEAGILVNKCDICGVSEWMGRALSIQLHHRNGVASDHRLENLVMLCPNCHSQTSTFGTRNRKQRTKQRRSDTVVPGGVTGNTPDSESGDSRFEALPGSISWPHRLEA